MVDLVVAKIQNKRGLERDLPQPLDPGELGLCIDSGKMFIGAEPINGGFIALQALLKNSADQVIANDLFINRIVQLDLGAAPLAAPFTVDDIRQEIVNESGNGSPDEIIVVEDTVNETFRAYLGYRDIPTTPVTLPTFTNVIWLPNPASIVVRRFGQITNQTITDNLFNIGDLIDLAPETSPAATDDPYVVADIGAVTEILNKIYLDGSSTGLAHVLQNLEIITTFSDIAELAISPDQVISAVSFALSVTPNAVIDSFLIAESDSFTIEYSVTNETNYNRTGTLTIASTLTPSATSLSDRFTEINPNDISLIFDVVVSGINIDLRSTTTTAGLTLRTITRRWRSF